jgi:hypothetical protein
VRRVAILEPPTSAGQERDIGGGAGIAATLVSFLAGRTSDRLGRRGLVVVLALGVALFAAAYVGFALTGVNVVTLALPFLAAGVAIGCVKTAEHAAVAALAPGDIRGSALPARYGASPRQPRCEQRRRTPLDGRPASGGLRLPSVALQCSCVSSRRLALWRSHAVVPASQRDILGQAGLVLSRSVTSGSQRGAASLRGRRHERAFGRHLLAAPGELRCDDDRTTSSG